MADLGSKNVRVAVRRKHCPSCGKPFTYPMERGRDRRYCEELDCYNARHLEQRISRKATAPRCGTKGCSGKATRKSTGTCEACYCRIRRNGSANKTPIKGVYAAGGYRKVLDPGHPLSDGGGLVFEHRMVLYGHIGPGTHPCFWCGKQLEWKRITVDHLNENKTDNRVENLVVACNQCNRARGQFIGFINRMRPDRLTPLMGAFSEVVNARR